MDSIKRAMKFSADQENRISELISLLNEDRAWLLEQIDRGRWPELRLDLAALEREMGQLLIRASEEIQ